MLLHIFIFRQKKLEKVMEEEGLKDEEVINIGKFSLQPGVAGRVLSSKSSAVVHRGKGGSRTEGRMRAGSLLDLGIYAEGEVT